jgi:hypothetical protein
LYTARETEAISAVAGSMPQVRVAGGQSSVGGRLGRSSLVSGLCLERPGLDRVARDWAAKEMAERSVSDEGALGRKQIRSSLRR